MTHTAQEASTPRALPIPGGKGLLQRHKPVSTGLKHPHTRACSILMATSMLIDEPAADAGREENGAVDQADENQPAGEQEGTEAKILVKYLHSVARDPSLYREADKKARSRLLAARQEMKAERQLELQNEADASRDSPPPASPATTRTRLTRSRADKLDTGSQFFGVSSDPNASQEHLPRALRERKPTRPEGPPKRRRRKAKPRGSSPVHYRIDSDELEKYGPAHLRGIPLRKEVDAVTRASAALFDAGRGPKSNNSILSAARSSRNDRYSTIELLLSPVRKRQPAEEWSPREIVLFELGVCEYGEDFSRVAEMLPEKRISDVVRFYYDVWRQSANYNAWACAGLSAEQREEKNEAFRNNAEETAKAYIRAHMVSKGEENAQVPRLWKTEVRSTKGRGRKRRRV